MLPAVSGIEQPDLLIERAVVIDDDDSVDAEASGSLELGQMIIKTTVAGET